MYKTYYVYILASKKNGTLYVGVTNDIVRRVEEHKNGVNAASFTNRYRVTRLVYYEEFGDIEEAIHREKCMKEWKRCWKIELIIRSNPTWQDLYDDFMEVPD